MNKLVLISAGHSQTDSGAVGNNYVEAVVAVEMRDRVAAILRAADVSVLTDGADGQNEPLKKAIILAQKSDIAVEFHLNASTNGAANGVECLSLPSKKGLSQKIAQAIVGETGSKLRGENGWVNQNAGQHHRLGFCVVGGIIVELCFISNQQEVENFMAKRGEVARAVANLIIDIVEPKSANTYIVVKGDTLYGISNRFKITVQKLMELNDLPDARIVVGQELYVRK